MMSYCMLAGRCRFCGVKIKTVYILSEVVLSGFAVICCLCIQEESFKVYMFGVLTYVLGVIDWQFKQLPVSLTIGLILSGIAYHICIGTIEFACKGAFISAIVLWMIRYLANRYYKQEAIGLGDVFLLSGIGAYWGINTAMVSFQWACIVGGVYGVVLILIKKIRKKDTIAFGPCLIVGFWLTYLWL